MADSRDKQRWIWLGVFIIACELTGFLSSLVSNTRNNAWYDALVKPSWNPPDFVFGPVWVMLYFLMGIALWVVVFDKPDGKNKAPAVVLFVLQLFFNFLWSVAFFRMQSPFGALLDILVLLLLIIMTMVLFARHSKIAAYMLIPYLLWVTFAAVLNFEIWRLNG